MRLHVSTSFLASVAAAVLAGGLLFTPPSSVAQGDSKQQGAQITVTGTCVNPDGSPAVKLPVEITAPLKGGIQQDPGGTGGDAPDPGLLQGGGDKGKGGAKRSSAFQTLAKGVTDDSGRFSLKFKPIGKVVTVAVGDPSKTSWAKKSVNTEGKDMDVGTIQLKAPGTN